jgi:tRNA (mo5U34)-methyltransferase
VWTDGWFDHRDVLPRFGLPEDMTGMRALDIGTWDGFWAFEMERRGADVVALDLDHESQFDWPRRLRPETFEEGPRGDGFFMAREIKGSAVERVTCSIYDALPDDLGTFDFVYCGHVLSHLRDQMRALERISDLCKPGARFVNAEIVDPWLDRVPVALVRFRGHHDRVMHWKPNIKAWKRMLWTAGFDDVRLVAKFRMPAKDMEVPNAVFHSRKGAGAT